MKLIRFGDAGKERPGLQLNDGTRLDASSFVQDYDERFFENDGLRQLASWLDSKGADAPRVDADTRLGPPVCRPGKLICVGLNYRDHAKESNMEIPKEPVLFFKATSAITGPNDPLVIPKGGEKVDWEVELAIVIGQHTSYATTAEAKDAIAGYVLHNDYSERSFQLERGGQWVKGKSCDTFAPLGPYLATKDEIADPQNLDVWLKVNGQTRQQSNTREMIFDCYHIVSYISQFMSLQAGDIISTGTAHGVGIGFKPSVFLKPGDVVELGVDGLGTSRQEAVAWS